jgi:hypothetical protein
MTMEVDGMANNIKGVNNQFRDLMQHFNREVKLIEESKENEMYMSIMIGVLVITTDFTTEHINMSEIASYSITDTENDGGILSFTLKGNNKELVIGCTSPIEWKKAKEWLKINEKAIIEGMTKAIDKDKKKARF